MALGKCPECDGQLSTSALSCPHCGNTSFVRSTDLTKKARCPDCQGFGIKWYESDSAPLSHYSLCDFCQATGEVDLVEWKNDVDGSLSYRTRKPDVSRDYFSELPRGPAAPTRCPDCGSTLAYMRSESSVGESGNHVYRCDRQSERLIRLEPCTLDLFRVDKVGRVARRHYLT
jgi:predicted RNA-binding Zn-ribbon protein involved in translation (DUF1610 family)